MSVVSDMLQLVVIIISESLILRDRSNSHDKTDAYRTYRTIDGSD
jgi:hypothetical protein